MAFLQLRDQLRAQAGEGIGRQDQPAIRLAREILQGGLDLGVVRTGAAIACTACDGPAASTDRMKNLDCGDVSGLNITATRERLGAISLSRSTHFPPTEKSYMLKPVRLPPGLVMFATKPCSTGSETCTNTTGTLLVACWITVRLVVEAARMTSGVRPINCAA